MLVQGLRLQAGLAAPAPASDAAVVVVVASRPVTTNTLSVYRTVQ